LAIIKAALQAAAWPEMGLSGLFRAKCKRGKRKRRTRNVDDVDAQHSSLELVL